MLEFLMNPYIVFILVVLGLSLLGVGLRCIGKLYAQKYGDTQVAKAIFATEKWASEKAKEQYITNQDKKDKAIEIIKNKIYPKLPVYVTLFVSEANLIEAIDFLYYSALDYLDDGELNKSLPEIEVV